MPEPYVPSFTFEWSAEGQIAPAPHRVRCASIVEALLWFHLERQLKEGLAPAAYRIERVTSDQTPAQSWTSAELPRLASLQHCNVTRAMQRAFGNELKAAVYERGWVVNVV